MNFIELPAPVDSVHSWETQESVLSSSPDDSASRVDCFSVALSRRQFALKGKLECLVVFLVVTTTGKYCWHVVSGSQDAVKHLKHALYTLQ